MGRDLEVERHVDAGVGHDVDGAVSQVVQNRLQLRRVAPAGDTQSKDGTVEKSALKLEEARS
jgi:hypothetical protein